jgi:hypothetical protein
MIVSRTNAQYIALSPRSKSLRRRIWKNSSPGGAPITADRHRRSPPPIAMENM